MSEVEDTGLSDTVLRDDETAEEGAEVMVCLDEEVILEFLDRRLPQARAVSVEAHIDGCGACRQLLALAAQDERVPPPAPEPGPPLRLAETLELLGPGELVDHFEVKLLLGRGGMGEVYLAKDKRLKRNVALKLIAEKLLESEEAKQRFLVEARATARFSHPNIVAIHSVGEHRGRPFIALEYVEGETLRARMDAGRPGLGEALMIASAIAEALREAHAAHVLHRDLKPQNIILARDGRPRVLDFGLAKLRPRVGAPQEPGHSLLDASTAVQAELTARESIRGTPGYMAPEQWKNEAITEAADIWAFGVILYEMLSGERPYRETSAISYAVRVCEPAPAPPLPAIAGVPQRVAALAERCLAKDPKVRPSAVELTRELAAIVAEEQIDVVADLERAAARWEQSGGVEGALWDEGALARAEKVMERAIPLGAGAARFLSASIRRSRDTERRKRKRVTALGATAAVLGAASLVSAFIALERRNAAEQDRRRAEHARAAALVESASRAFAERDVLEARAKLRSALEIEDSPLARVLWWRIEQDALVWSRVLGTGVFDVAFSPDGRTVAAAGQDKTVYLLDAETLALTSLRGHGDQVMKLAFSPDGTRLASGSWSGELRVWNLADHSVRVLSGLAKRPSALIFRTAELLLAAEYEGALLAWDLRSGAGTPEPWARATRGSFDLAPSPDGKLLYSAEKDGKVRVFDAATREVTQELDAGKGAVLTLALSPDGTRLATGGDDRIVRLRELATGAVTELGAHDNAVQRVRFAEGGLLVSVGQDRIVRTFELGGDRRDRLEGHRGPVWSVAAGPGGTFATASHDGSVRLWRSRTRGHLTSAGHADGVAGLAFSRDGRWLASGGYDRVLRVWDAESGAEVRALTGHEGTIYGVAADPRGRRWATASYDRTVRVWSAENGRLESVLTGHSEGVYAVAFDPTGTRLASAGTDRSVRIWDLSTGTEQAQLTGHGGPVFALAFSPDGQRLASGSADRTIRVWELAGKKKPRVLTGHEGSVWGVAFTSEGELVSGAYDQTVRVWGRGGSRVLGRHEGRVYAVDVHGDHVLSGGADGVAIVWDLATGKERLRIAGHRGEVNRVRFGRGGVAIATASDDGTVRLWDAESGRSFWRAPVLAGTRLATQAGWIELGDSSPRSAEARWEKQLGAARLAGVGLNGARACAITGDGALEAWELAADRLVFRADSVAAREVRVFGAGCAVLVKDRVLLFDEKGAFRERTAGATALEVTREGELLIAAGDRVLALDARGEAREELAGGPGVTALARAGGHVFLGFENGTIEPAQRLAADGAGGAPRFSFERTPSSAITRLAEGPMETVIAGYANGHVGVWSTKNGAQLYSAQIHGPVIHLAVAGGAIWGASELGAVLAGPDDFALSHCALLARVWSEIPVVWSDGLPISADAPSDHPCRRRGP